MVSPILPVNPIQVEPEPEFDWAPAINQSMRFLLLEHAVRFGLQPGTRKRLGGPFMRDYAESVTALKGWGDGDHWFINYVNHPVQGSMSSFIQIQNDRVGRKVEFGKSREYWNSRLRALAWNTAYSMQWELGPISEASLGNVGQRKGTQGYVDLVMTPVGGFGMTIAEDALDRWLSRREDGRGRRSIIIYRTLLNPSRSFANVMRGKWPWYRDARE